MSKEYFSIGPSQQTYGKKHLLYSEMGILTSMKKYEKYKKLRKEELALKNLLKKAVNSLKDELSTLDHLLPKTKRDVLKPEEIEKSRKKRKDIEGQIDDIKERIAALQD